MAGSLILYVDGHWSNTFDCAPYVALREKGIAFSTAVALVNAGVSPFVRHAAITGLEPALQHGEFWLSESLAIIEYLEEAFPPPDYPALWPTDLRDRARARQLMSWIRMELNDLRAERISTNVFYPPRRALPPLGPLAARQAEQLFSVIERLAPRHDALLGRWCIADVDMAFAVMRLIRTGFVPIPDVVRAYAEAVWHRPSIREYVEHPRPPHPPQ
jgi:glutathione S-transferase